MKENFGRTISIIVPVFNTSAYLEKCIISLINQSYQDLEIILVNDGSTDNSGVICNKYAQIDSRIIVLYEENAGLSAARNLGLANATGSYIAFVDSDDYCDTNMFSEMINEAIKNNVDIVIAGSYYVKENKLQEHEYFPDNQLLDIETIRHLILTDSIGSQAWSKLFKKELWKDITFPVGRIYEDIATIFKCFYNTNNPCAYICKPLYFYVLRNDSLSFKKSPAQGYGLFFSFKERYEYSASNNLAEKEICLVKACMFAQGIINNSYTLYKYDQSNPTVAEAKLFISQHINELTSSKMAPIKYKLLAWAYVHVQNIYVFFITVARLILK